RHFSLSQRLLLSCFVTDINISCFLGDLSQIFSCYGY
ncbi:unnamed protein product, partial [Arabidopsis halleri]